MNFFNQCIRFPIYRYSEIVAYSRSPIKNDDDCLINYNDGTYNQCLIEYYKSLN